jgi:hypothetical protein
MCMGEVRSIQSLLSRPEGRRHRWECTGLSGLGLGKVVDSCEHDTEHVGSVKYVELLDWLSVLKLVLVSCTM